MVPRSSLHDGHSSNLWTRSKCLQLVIVPLGAYLLGRHLKPIANWVCESASLVTWNWDVDRDRRWFVEQDSLPIDCYLKCLCRTLQRIGRIRKFLWQTRRLSIDIWIYLWTPLIWKKCVIFRDGLYHFPGFFASYAVVKSTIILNSPSLE